VGPLPVSDPAAEPVYLIAAQVGQWLQVSEKSIYRWAQDDASMPVLRIGGTVRFPRERLERWLREREQGRPRIAETGACTGEVPVRAGGHARMTAHVLTGVLNRGGVGAALPGMASLKGLGDLPA
jgi:excisionase family DNA binding protein